MFFDNSTNIRAHSGPTEINLNAVDFARPRAETSGETRRLRVTTRAKSAHFARPSGTPSPKKKLRALPSNNLGARAQKPLVQNPADRAQPRKHCFLA